MPRRIRHTARWVAASAAAVAVIVAGLWWYGDERGPASGAVVSPAVTVTVTASPASPGASASPSGQAASAPEPVVRGDQLIDSRSGAPFVPRGVDWSSFEYACTQGWGYSALDTLGADGGAAVARAMRGWDIDTVRLPLNEDCWLGTRGAPVSGKYATLTAAGYRAAVAGFVADLNAEGIVVILDLQSRRQQGADTFDDLPMPDAQSLTFWRQVAAAYASDRSVMFDAFNEPYSIPAQSGHPAFSLTWQCWSAGGCTAPVTDADDVPTGPSYRAVGMTQVVKAIRTAGASQPILLGGLDYANDLSEWLQYAPHDDQLVAAVHSYDFKPCSDASCWDSVLAPLAERVPLLTSELGATNPLGGYVSSYLDWADAHHVGVLFWAWEDSSTDSMALTLNETGTPTAYGRLAQGWLAKH